MDRQKLLLSVCDYASTDEYMYFVPRNLLGFFEYDIGLKSIEPMKTMEKMELCEYGYGTVCKFKEKLIFAQYYKHDFLIYDVKEFQLIKTINPSLYLGKDGKVFRYYIRTIIHNNCIFFLGDSDSEILVLDMDTMNFFVVETWKKAISEYMGKEQFIGISTYRDICVVNESVWIPLRCSNCILEMDLNTTRAKIHKVDTEKMIFTTICFDGGCFWLTGEKKVIVKWDPQMNSVELLNQFPEDFVNIPKRNQYWNGMFVSSSYEKDYVIFFPMTANMAIRVHATTNKIEKFYQGKESLSCYMVKKWSEDIFYVEWGKSAASIDKSMLIDLNGKVLDTDIFSIEWKRLYLQDFDKKEEVYTENDLLSLKEFFLTRICHMDKAIENPNKGYGKYIHKTI